MVTIHNYDDIVEHLERSFKYGTQGNNNSRVAGLLFARPNSFTKEEILSDINYFHIRSGKFIDFFFIGYQPKDVDPSLPIVASVGGEKWCFDVVKFNQLRNDTESLTNWTYGGGVELVLFNSFLSTSNKIELDFSDAVCIDLVEAKGESLISGVGHVFEKIFKIAENITTNNPSKEMSLKLTGTTGKKSIINILFNLLPESIRQETRKIFLFGTSNYSR